MVFRITIVTGRRRTQWRSTSYCHTISHSIADWTFFFSTCLTLRGIFFFPLLSLFLSSSLSPSIHSWCFLFSTLSYNAHPPHLATEGVAEIRGLWDHYPYQSNSGEKQRNRYTARQMMMKKKKLERELYMELSKGDKDLKLYIFERKSWGKNWKCILCSVLLCDVGSFAVFDVNDPTFLVTMNRTY